MSLTASEIRPDRVAIYIRWSTEDQGEGTTLEVQREACKAFIISQGWRFRNDLIFVDDGISGASMERPALGRLRALVKRREVDCVVVFKLDRLSRSVLDMLKLVMEEWDGLCAVKSAKEPIDTISPTGRMFFYQLMSFAEWERNVIRDRMFSGRLRRAQEGKLPGFTLPYGFRKEPATGAVVQVPEQAAVVRRIFQLYLGGLGARLVTRKLMEQGYTSPSGAAWTEPMVMKVIRNPAYKGTLVFGRTRRVKGKVVPAKEPHVVREGVFPAIVRAEDWEAAQKLRRERPAPGQGRGHFNGRTAASENLLTGLLRCTCGRSCTGVRVRAGRAEYRYYACAGSHNTGSHICDSGNVRQESLDELVTAKLLAHFRGAGARERLAEQLTARVRDAHRQALRERQAAEQELARLAESERRVKGLMIDGRLSVEEYRELQAEVAAKLAEARTALTRAVETEAQAEAAAGREEQNSSLCDRLGEWEMLSTAEKKLLLRQFVAGIEVCRDKGTGTVICEIAWRFATPEGANPVEFSAHPRGAGRGRRSAEGRERSAERRLVPVG